MKAFDGKHVDCRRYPNGNLAVVVHDTDGMPYATLSVNTDVKFPEGSNLFVLSHNVNMMTDWINATNLFRYTRKRVQYGYCDQPVVEYIGEKESDE